MPLRRRTFLRGAATAGAVGVAGCSDTGDGTTSSGTEQGTTTPTGTAGSDQLGTGTATDGWSTGGANHQNTSHVTDSAPGGELGVEWSVETDGGRYSTTAVRDGTVYYATSDSQTELVYAFDAATSEQQWKQTAEDPATVGEASLGPPTVADGTVYVAEEYGHLLALDADTGELEWEKTNTGYNCPLRYADGTLYVVSPEKELLALDASTGDQQWSASPASPGTVSYASGTVYYDRPYEGIRALDAETGEEQWQSDEGGGATTCVAGDYLLTDSVVLSVADGSLEWEIDYSTYSATVAAAGSVAVIPKAHFESAGGVAAFDLASGEELWSVEREPSFYGAAVADGLVIAASDEPAMYGFDVGDGTQQWRFETGGRFQPVVADGRIYGGGETLYALSDA